MRFVPSNQGVYCSMRRAHMPHRMQQRAHLHGQPVYHAAEAGLFPLVLELRKARTDEERTQDQTAGLRRPLQSPLAAFTHATKVGSLVSLSISLSLSLSLSLSSPYYPSHARAAAMLHAIIPSGAAAQGGDLCGGGVQCLPLDGAGKVVEDGHKDEGCVPDQPKAHTSARIRFTPHVVHNALLQCTYKVHATRVAYYPSAVPCLVSLCSVAECAHCNVGPVKLLYHSARARTLAARSNFSKGALARVHTWQHGQMFKCLEACIGTCTHSGSTSSVSKGRTQRRRRRPLALPHVVLHPPRHMQLDACITPVNRTGRPATTTDHSMH